MAHTKSQKKHIKVSEQRRKHNVSRKSMMKTFLKKANLALKIKELSEPALNNAKESFQKIQSILDRFATKGLIHKNKAARYKSKLSIKMNNLFLEK